MSVTGPDNARYSPLSAYLGYLDSGGNYPEGRTLLLDGRHALGLRQLGRGGAGQEELRAGAPRVRVHGEEPVQPGQVVGRGVRLDQVELRLHLQNMKSQSIHLSPDKRYQLEILMVAE